MIIKAHLVHPYAKLWGNGSTSSSDGQFFRAAGRSAKRSGSTLITAAIPAAVYTCGSDQHGHFHILPMGATEDEAVYVLDGLYGHESRIDIDEHYVDTGGASYHVFSLFALGGKRVAPRLRDLKDWRLHTFEARRPTRPSSITSATASMPLQSARAGMKRCALRSIEDRLLVPSTVLKKLAALPKTNVLSRALREIGRIERTLFMTEWYSSPELRDRCRVGLNKGEAGNKLARAGFFTSAAKSATAPSRARLPRFRPQPGGQRHRLVEHRLSLPGPREPAGRRARPAGSPDPPCLTADLGTHQPHRHLRLAGRGPAQRHLPPAPRSTEKFIAAA